MKTIRHIWLAVLLVGLLALAACGQDDGATAQEPQERTIAIQALQYDMTRHVDRTPFPDTLDEHPDFADKWPGWRLDEPDEDGEWYARAYVFNPSTIVVNEGDEVTLRLFGIHGDSHPSVIEGYDVTFDIRRGEVDEVTFTADKPGVFRMICADHVPSMIGQLVVLPSS
jgi:heme/copper-type cytochrome/quinol oxidase subunit 2